VLLQSFCFLSLVLASLLAIIYFIYVIELRIIIFVVDGKAIAVEVVHCLHVLYFIARFHFLFLRVGRYADL